MNAKASVDGLTNIQALQNELIRLDPFFREIAPKNEAAERLVPEVIAELGRLNLHKLLVPRSLGGHEASISEAFDVIEQISYSDASTGWVVFATAFSTSAAAAYLADPAVSKIFHSDAPGRVVGVGAPTGTASRVNGGYELRGKWSYGSGILHADWVHVGAAVTENGKPRLTAAGEPEYAMLHVPVCDVTFGGNWNVLGLKSTGSIDFSIEGAFVSDDFVFPAQAPVARRRSDIYGQGIIPIVVLGHAPWAAGAGRRMLDELSAYVKKKGNRAGSLAASDSFHERFAEAQARILSGRALMRETFGLIASKLKSGEAFTTRDTTLLRLSLANTTYAATDVAEFAYRIAGGETLRSGTMQRVYRDIHAGSQHYTSASAVVKDCGRDLAGLADGEDWGSLGLVKRSGTAP